VTSDRARHVREQTSRCFSPSQERVLTDFGAARRLVFEPNDGTVTEKRLRPLEELRGDSITRC
jgi:hypothetical protein